MKYSALYHGFPATFHVISRKIDFLWDSVYCIVCRIVCRMRIPTLATDKSIPICAVKCIIHQKNYA